MKVLLIFGLAAAGLMICCLLWGCQGQQRGLNGQIFVSNGRPALAVIPEEGLRLHSSGWCDVAPATRSAEPASAKLWYALYERDAQARPGRLLALLAEGQGKWRWPFEPGSARDVLRRSREDTGHLAAYYETILAPADRDPWADAWDVRWQNGSLIRRCRMFFMDRQVKLVLEYREPVDADRPLPVHMDMPLLAGFEQRAGQAFTLALRDDGAEIPDVASRPGTAPGSLSRRALAAWLGEMYQRGEVN